MSRVIVVHAVLRITVHPSPLSSYERKATSLQKRDDVLSLSLGLGQVFSWFLYYRKEVEFKASLKNIAHCAMYLGPAKSSGDTTTVLSDRGDIIGTPYIPCSTPAQICVFHGGVGRHMNV